MNLPQKSTSGTTSASQRPINNAKQQPPTATLSDAYPNNFVVQYMMPTTVPQFIMSVNQATPSATCTNWNQHRTLLGIFAFLFISYKSCAVWNEGDICASRVSYLAYVVQAVLFGLTGYTYFLRRKMGRSGRQALAVANDV